MSKTFYESTGGLDPIQEIKRFVKSLPADLKKHYEDVFLWVYPSKDEWQQWMDKALIEEGYTDGADSGVFSNIDTLESIIPERIRKFRLLLAHVHQEISPEHISFHDQLFKFVADPTINNFLSECIPARILDLEALLWELYRYQPSFSVKIKRPQIDALHKLLSEEVCHYTVESGFINNQDIIQHQKWNLWSVLSGFEIDKQDLTFGRIQLKLKADQIYELFKYLYTQKALWCAPAKLETISDWLCRNFEHQKGEVIKPFNKNSALQRLTLDHENPEVFKVHDSLIPEYKRILKERQT